ncbi:hypothetical protein NPIL_277621 [Nephila pilipes]|uniref:Uncharacterized protein n=1 Tax=Nephila pilipes TaxID=299642 RepID=A0A8X6PA82_NEPPI|nr:hypothetical protein NPIL_277621 [Nephila pilipes]
MTGFLGDGTDGECRAEDREKQQHQKGKKGEIEILYQAKPLTNCLRQKQPVIFGTYSSIHQGEESKSPFFIFGEVQKKKCLFECNGCDGCRTIPLPPRES